MTQRYVAFSFVVAAALIFLSGGEASAVLAVTNAKIEAGKLIVSGTTTSAGQQVTLDAQFNATSNASKVFTFNLTNYRPPTCIVKLKAGAETKTAVVANCGPEGPAGVAKRAIASATLRLSADTERTGQIVTKDFQVTFPGTVRVTWEMKSALGSLTADVYSRSIEQIQSQTVSVQTYTQYVSTVRVVAGDVIRITVSSGTGATIFLRNARISYDLVDAGQGVVVQN